MKIEKLPMGKKILYAMGQLGWSLGSFGVMNMLYYFYDSNIQPDGNRMFPLFIAAAAVLGVIAGLSRLFDAVTDPLIAGLSDRSKSSFGRRRTFMAIGVVPFALLSVFVFMPLSTSTVLNTAVLAVEIVLFYLFMTMYVTPYFALMSELGHTPDERLQLSTMISITWALGFMGGNSIYAVQGLFEQTGMTATGAFQTSIAVMALISFICMLLPVIFINEKRYCLQASSEESSFQAVISAFRNRNFRYFCFSDLTYFLALTFIQTGISFYVIRLLQLPKEMTTTLMLMLFILSFLFYVPIGLLARKTGKKKMLNIAFVLFILSWIVLSLWGYLPFSPEIQAYAGILTAAFPLAIFGILPNAVVADIAEADGIMTGNHKAAVFFGARTFMSKAGASITLLIFPFITHAANAGTGEMTVTGLRLTTVTAIIFLILGLLLFQKYNEKEVLETLEKEDSSK